MENRSDPELKQAENEVPINIVDTPPEEAASVLPAPTVVNATTNPSPEPSPKPRANRGLKYYSQKYYTTGSRWLTIGLCVLTIVCGCAAIASHNSDLNTRTFHLGMVLFAAWTNLLILTTLRVAERKSTALLHTAIPIILGNTMSTWGAALGGGASVLEQLSPAIEHQARVMPHAETHKFWAILVGSAAYGLYLLLITLLSLTIFIFVRFYRWLGSQPSVRSEMSSRFATYAGGITGLCFGFAALWLTLNATSSYDAMLTGPIAIHTTMWAFGIVMSEHFFSAVLKALDREPGSPHT